MVEDDGFTRLQRGIESSVDNGEMLVKWVAITEVMDADGDRGTWVAHSEDSTIWDTLGLLDFAVTRMHSQVDMMIKAQTAMAFEEESDGEDDDE